VAGSSGVAGGCIQKAAIEDTANRLEQSFNDFRQGIRDSLNSLSGESADDNASARADAGEGSDSSAD
jgi:hypothetical protein